MPRRFSFMLMLAGLLTVLNCCTPLHSDDAAYYRFARQIASAPLDPYGFQFPDGSPANHILAPPVVLYWWAIALRLFGMQPILWKLWFFPFNLLLVFSVHALFRRWCRGLEGALVTFTVLAPTCTLNLNLMLDLPAVALSFAGFVLFQTASRRHSLLGTLVAGLMTGLAMQAKYTAFLGPILILIDAALYRRVRLGVFAACVAMLIFAGWEAFVALRYGESHFLCSLQAQSGLIHRCRGLVLPLIGLLGSAAPLSGLLALAGLGLRARGMWVGLGLILAGYVAALCVPSAWAVLLRDPRDGRPWLTLSNLVFGFQGLLVMGATVAAARRLFSGNPKCASGWSPRSRRDAFLVGWLLLEVTGYFLLSPTPGLRRVLRLVLVGTLLAGRLAQRSKLPARALAALALANGLLGLAFGGIAAWDARAEQIAAEQAAQYVQTQGSGNGWCYLQHWNGFEFYAGAAGLHRLGEERAATLKPGDWIVLGERAYGSKPFAFSNSAFAPYAQLNVADRLPVRAISVWRSAVERHEGPRVLVSIYRFLE